MFSAFAAVKSTIITHAEVSRCIGTLTYLKMLEYSSSAAGGNEVLNNLYSLTKEPVRKFVVAVFSGKFPNKAVPCFSLRCWLSGPPVCSLSDIDISYCSSSLSILTILLNYHVWVDSCHTVAQVQTQEQRMHFKHTVVSYVTASGSRQR